MSLLDTIGSALSYGINSLASIWEGSNSGGTDRTPISSVAQDAEDDLDSGTRETMTGISRALSNNSGFPRAVVNDIARHAIGTGIIPYSTIEDDATAKRFNDYWSEWVKRCELSGTKDFPEFCRMLSKRMDIDGDVGTVMTTLPEDRVNGVPYPVLQGIEAHRIGAYYDGIEWHGGVKLDTLGRPMLYRVYTGPTRTEFRDIPAAAFYLLAETDRLDLRRSPTSLAHALNSLRDVKDIVGFEKKGVKINSAIAAVITRNSTGPQAFFGGQTRTNPGTPQDLTLESIFSGTIPRVQPGESVSSFAGNRPSATFAGFLEWLNRDAAVGAGIPLEFVWDASRVGGATQRFVLQKAQAKFDERQQTFARFIRRVWVHVMSHGIERGELPRHPEWFKHQCQPPSKITVDVGREALANRDDVRAGLRTLQEDYAERGRFWQDARRQTEEAAVDLLNRARRLVARFGADGLTLTDAINLLEQRGATPMQPPPPEPAQDPNAK